MKRLFILLAALWTFALQPATAFAQFDGFPGSRPRAGSAGNVRVRGMPIGLLLFQCQTLTAAAASVAFSNIPQGYEDLVLIGYARGTTAASNVGNNFTLNNDTSSNVYDMTYGTNVSGSWGSGVNYQNTSFQIANIPGSTATANYFTQSTAVIAGYSSTAGYKALSGEGGSPGNSIGMVWNTGQYKSLSAVTSLQAFPASGSYAAGSNFCLYVRGLR